MEGLVFTAASNGSAGKIDWEANRVASQGRIVMQCSLDGFGELPLLSTLELIEVFRLPSPKGAIRKLPEALDPTVAARTAVTLEAASGGNIRSSKCKLAAELLKAFGSPSVQRPNVSKV
jgi:hypothetical protein